MPRRLCRVAGPGRWPLCRTASRGRLAAASHCYPGTLATASHCGSGPLDHRVLRASRLSCRRGRLGFCCSGTRGNVFLPRGIGADIKLGKHEGPSSSRRGARHPWISRHLLAKHWRFGDRSSRFGDASAPFAEGVAEAEAPSAQVDRRARMMLAALPCPGAHKRAFCSGESACSHDALAPSAVLLVQPSKEGGFAHLNSFLMGSRLSL